MGKGRLEAFSDGVIAIIITIMVLELKVPHESSFASLAPLLPVLLSYVLSFVYVGIYWNNHHHMLAVCRRVSGGALWANLHLLFWLSLFPFTTAWMGENHFAAAPTAAYGGVLLMAAMAYWFLQRTLIGARRRRIGAAARDRQRLERQALAGAVCSGHRVHLLDAVVRVVAVRRGGGVVAGA